MKISKFEKSMLPTDQRIVSLSYSLLSCSNNIEDLLNYIFGKKELSTDLEFGKLFHANMAEEKINIKKSIEDKITEKYAFLGLDSISQTFFMSELLNMNNKFKKLTKGEIEKEIRLNALFTYKGYNFLLSGFVDAYNKTDKNLLELKTARSFKNIQDRITKYGYDLQAYMYRLLAYIVYDSVHTVEFVFVLKMLPYYVYTLKCNSEIISSGQSRFFKYIDQFIVLMETYNLQKYFCI